MGLYLFIYLVFICMCSLLPCGSHVEKLRYLASLLLEWSPLTFNLFVKPSETMLEMCDKFHKMENQHGLEGGQSLVFYVKPFMALSLFWNSLSEDFAYSPLSHFSIRTHCKVLFFGFIGPSPLCCTWWRKIRRKTLLGTEFWVELTFLSQFFSVKIMSFESCGSI